MNFKKTLLALTTALVLSNGAFAGESLDHSGAASVHSGQAVAHGVGGAVQGASAIAAVPLLLVGEIGAASESAGTAMMDFASEALPIGHDSLHGALAGTAPSDSDTPDPAMMFGDTHRDRYTD